jgi:hypothetical protein
MVSLARSGRKSEDYKKSSAFFGKEKKPLRKGDNNTGTQIGSSTERIETACMKIWCFATDDIYMSVNKVSWDQT